MAEEIQTGKEFTPADRMVIKDLETLRAMSDPLRVQILETMLQGARTVKQIAQELGTTPTKLYYHVNMLERHGLIKVTGTRVVSGIIEKQYQMAAYGFDIDHSLLSPSGSKMDEDMQRLLSTVMDSVRRDIARSVDAGLVDLSKKREPGERTFMLLRTLNRIPEAKAKEFVSRFEALLKEFDSVNADEPADRVYGMMLAFYPSIMKTMAHKPDKKEKEKDNE
jgi:DNA-binding transcriptional ArsR family regulator